MFRAQKGPKYAKLINHNTCFLYKCKICGFIGTNQNKCEVCNLEEIDVIGPLWSGPLVDYNSDLINLMRDLIRPTYLGGGELTSQEGSGDMYNYLSKSLKEKYIQKVPFSQDLKKFQTLLGIKKYLSKQELFSGFRTYLKTEN